MVGRTRLYQRTGSPLIQGATGARRRKWLPWAVAAVVIIAAVWFYLSYLR
jgi:hypothetical protein